MLDFNTYLEEKKKKEVVKINPKKEDLYEKDDKAEDCTGSDHTKSEKKRRKEDVNDGPDVQNEQSLKPSDRFKRDAGAIAKKKLRQKEHNKYVNFLDVDESRLTGANDMQSKLYAANNKSGKKMTDDEIKKQKGGKEFLDRIKAAKSKMSEGVYTGPDKKDRAVIKKMDNKKFAAKLADYEKNMDPKKRQALKDKATKGMKFTHESAPMGKSDGQLANTYEENAYDSAEESTKEIQKEISKETFNALKDTLVEKAFSIYERTRYAKETGKDPQTGNESKKGGTMKGSAMAAVRKNLVKSGGLMSSRKKPINPQGKKQVKGKKSDVGTGKYKKMADRKKEQANKAKKAGFKDTQSYADTMARYGGEDNYKKGRGLGS